MSTRDTQPPRRNRMHARQARAHDPIDNPAPSVAYTPEGHLSAETLSAWIDEPDAFSAADAERIRTQLAQDAVSRETLAELRLVVGALAALPAITPQRSFVLSEQGARAARPAAFPQRRDVAAPRVVHLQESNAWQRRQQGALRWASAAAALLLVFVLSIDAFTGSDESPPSSKDTAIVMGAASGGARDADLYEAPAEGYAPGDAAGGGSGGGETAASEGEESTAGDEAEMQPPAGGAAEEDDAADSEMASGTEAEEQQDTARSGATPAGGQAETEAQPEAESAEIVPETAMGTGPTALEATPDAETNAAADMLATDASLQPMSNLYADDDGGNTTLRLLEFGLAMLAIWLLIALLAVPYMRERSSIRRR